jgi:hypothetical protein
MSGLKIAGGILSLAGGALVLLMQILWMMDWGFTLDLLLWMIMPILAVLGGILLLAGKRAGGIIALIVGAIWTTMAILINILLGPLAWMDYLYVFPMFSFFAEFVGFTIWGYIFVEVVLVLVGGILGVAGGKD